MDTTIVIVLVVIGVLVIAGIATWLVMRRRRRTEQLRSSFGPEYDRAVNEAGGTRAAEAELSARQSRREDLDIRPISAAARTRYAEAWRQVQSTFVDAPAPAVQQADELVLVVMRDRGYPMDSFEQRAADVSVDHPHVVDNYRAAHAISLASDHGQASTEDLRQAMVHYRALFDELLSSGPTERQREAG
jgi:hypothetical protein